MAILASVVGTRAAKPVAWLLGCVAALALLYGAYSAIYRAGERGADRRWEAKTAEIRSARDAMALKAAELDALLARETSAPVKEKRKEIDDAVANLPDQGLSPRQRARACAELRRQGFGCETPAAPAGGVD